MVNHNDIYIDIDQNLSPIIYKTIEETTINLNYNSSVNFSSIWLSLIDIKTNEIIKDEEINNESIQNNQIKYNFELPLVSFQHGDKIGHIIKENDGNNYRWIWNEENCWNMNNGLAEALNEIIKKEKNENNWITEEKKLNLCSINPRILRRIINNFIEYGKIEQFTYNCIDAMLKDLDFSVDDDTISFIYFINRFAKNRYYKIQLKGIYNEEEYYSNYGISRIVDITDYSYEIYYDKKQDIYFLEYKTFLKDNLLNFYKYQIIDETGQIIQDEGWTLNEAENNKIEIDSTTNSKEYVTKIFFKNINLNLSEQYKIIFYGKTNLNLEFEKEKYIQSYDVYPLIFPAKINLINNYENGYIKINFIPYFNETFENDYFFNNNYYELYRADELSNFEKWEYITKFKINQYSIKTFNFKDYQIVQGIKYKYGIKAVNINNIKTQMIESNYIIADFEDMFLIDSELNLKIKFNPKISSFKITKNENKVETLGQKYPYIVRNGMLGYKEMPISGLISFQMDIDNKIFNENNNELKDFVDTDLVSENIMKERKYKNYILNWLNNNKYKVLKTPTEGNFIVQLTNISLTPIDSLGRMLHSFQATAYEMAEYNYENIQKYNIFSEKIIENKILNIESLNITKYYKKAELNNGVFNKILSNNLQIQITPNDQKVNILFDNIEITDIQLYGLDSETKIFLQYKNKTTLNEILIGNTRELFIPNAQNLQQLSFIFNYELNKNEVGITYSWNNNKILQPFNLIDNIEINTKNIQIESIDYLIANSDKIKISNIDSDLLINNLNYEKVNKIDDANGFFIIGNNIFDQKQKIHIHSYLYDKIKINSQMIAIPKSIKIYLKTKNLQDLNNFLNSSFFVEYDNYNFFLAQKIKSNQLYQIPKFGYIEIDNLDMINSLWIGKNLIADLSYTTYEAKKVIGE